MTAMNVILYTGNQVAQDHSHRLNITRWKSTKTKGDDGKDVVKAPLSPARCVSVPKLQLKIEPAILATSILAAMESLQDDYLRELMETELEKGDKPTFTIDVDALAPANLAKYAEEAASSDRLSGKKLVSWFDEIIAAPLLAKLCIKAGYDVGTDPAVTIPNDVSAKLARIVAASSKVIESFASPRASYDESTLANVEKLLALAPSSDNTKDALTAKIAKLRQPTAVSLELDL